MKRSILHACLESQYIDSDIFIADDEIYQKLKRTFLSNGKGRPPAPPQVPITNHLLLQMILLQTEGNRTGKDVSYWCDESKWLTIISISGVLLLFNLLLESVLLLYSCENKVSFQKVQVNLWLQFQNRVNVNSESERTCAHDIDFKSDRLKVKGHVHMT